MREKNWQDQGTFWHSHPPWPLQPFFVPPSTPRCVWPFPCAHVPRRPRFGVDIFFRSQGLVLGGIFLLKNCINVEGLWPSKSQNIYLDFPAYQTIIWRCHIAFVTSWMMHASCCLLRVSKRTKKKNFLLKPTIIVNHQHKSISERKIWLVFPQFPPHLQLTPLSWETANSRRKKGAPPPSLCVWLEPFWEPLVQTLRVAHGPVEQGDWDVESNGIPRFCFFGKQDSVKFNL